MEAVLTGVATNTISSIISVGVQLIDDVIRLDQNTLVVRDKLSRMKDLLEDMRNYFEHDQRIVPVTIQNWFQRLRDSLAQATELIDPPEKQKKHRWCVGRLFSRHRVATQIREWNTNFDQLFSNLQSDFSSLRNVQEMVWSAPLQADALLQTVPEFGYVGEGIESAKERLSRWLDAEDHQFGVIGIYGMGGIGKTSLLKTVYNTYKQLKANVFEHVIWLTVSHEFTIPDLQSGIGEAINLHLGSSTSNAESSTSNASETRKMKLSAFLKKKKFLLILDDLWRSIQLEEELGIPICNSKGSKVLISTRSIDLLRKMGANDQYSINMQPLYPNEGCQLFCRVAFKAKDAPTSLKDVAIQFAEECKGLPLAINVVAAAMIGNTNADEWGLALTQMKTVDPDLLTVYRDIDDNLFGPLKWSYYRLYDRNLQNCFLYCGAFPEDAEIKVERLVEMWIGEGLVNCRDTSQLMVAGRRYVRLLVERCLFQYARTDSVKYIKVHDIVRDMALHIAEREEKCLFRTSQKLDRFPGEQVMDGCKRIAIRYYNSTAILPTDFRCPELQTLILAGNESLREIPNGFLANLTSLRVLDLSDTNITSLPESLWQLKQLEFLGLSRTLINSLPDDLYNLTRLQFLHLEQCKKLNPMPDGSKLENIKRLKISNI